MTELPPPSFLRRNRYSLLLAALLLLAFMEPISQGEYVGQRTFNFILCLVMAAGAYAVSESKRMLMIALILGVPTVAATWAEILIRSFWPDFDDTATAVRLISQAVFLGFTAGLIMRSVLKGRRVTTDKLAGAAAVYLMLGIVWTQFYALAELVEPNSFKSSTEGFVLGFGDAEVHKTFSLLMYYSFVTLTTLGYGDIVPVSNAARSLAWLEAMVGQIYVVVIIARLVGLHVAANEVEKT